MYAIRGTAAVLFLITVTGASAQEAERAKITEKDKQVFRDFMKAAENKREEKTAAQLRLMAVIHLRMIGLAMFEFETEYGTFPNAETAPLVKEAAGFDGELAGETANDCFFQLIAAGILEDPAVFQWQKPVEIRRPGDGPAAGKSLEKCSFALISLTTAAGNPSQPLAVAPLINGRTTFDRKVFGGKAVVLRLDNSVSSYPIGEDGRVMVNGKDLFDPEQPYWKGDVPPIKWPEE